MILACLMLLAGVCTLQLNSFAAGADPGAVAVLAAVAAVVSRRPGAAWFWVGVAVFAVATARHDDEKLDRELVGDSIVAQVRIAGFPEHRAQTTMFRAQPVGDTRLPRRMRIAWFEPAANPEFGDVWELELRLRRPRSHRNPGTFDRETWLFRSGVGATGYVVEGPRNRRLASGQLDVVERFRVRAVDRIDAVVNRPGEAAVLAAVTVGARHRISREQWQRYAATGTSHLMAISGLHIGLVAAVAYVLGRIAGGLCLRNGRCYRVATLSAMTAAVGYACVSGMAVPARRAVLMIGLAAVATLRYRRLQPMRIACLACMTLVLANPAETLAPGFRLSFAAVAVLAGVAHRQRAAGRGGPRAALGRLLALQFGLLLGLMPLTVAEFHRIAFAAPVVNLVAVPVFSVVTVPCALAGLLLGGGLHVAGDALLSAAAWSLRAIEILIGIAADLPGLARPVPQMPGTACLLPLLPALWVALPPGWPGRNLAWLAVLAILMYVPPAPGPGCVAVDVLDVGQGLAVVVRTHRHALLYDTGPAFRGGGSIADTVVLPYLEAAGIDRLDRLIVSHADLDHAGGVSDVMVGIAVDRAQVGEIVDGLEADRCRAGDRWRYDGVDFELLHPVGAGVRHGNDASCVLLVAAGDYRILLTGDIEAPVEDELLRRGVLSRAFAVVVPHHGSRTSSTPAFVDALRPEFAIVSAGYGNHWGFPKRDVVDRWRAAGAAVFDTADSGAVGLRVCSADGDVSVLRYRDAARRIWHE